MEYYEYVSKAKETLNNFSEFEMKAELPKTYHDLHNLVWKAFEFGQAYEKYKIKGDF
jgi:hypothetical protein